MMSMPRIYVCVEHATHVCVCGRETHIMSMLRILMRLARWRSVDLMRLTSAVIGSTAAPRDTTHMTSVQKTNPHSILYRCSGPSALSHDLCVCGVCVYVCVHERVKTIKGETEKAFGMIMEL